MIGKMIGKYRVLQVLGQGGMGSVYLVELTTNGGRFALKLLHPHLARNEVVRQRFDKEARAVTAIGHRNVVEVTYTDSTPDGAMYIVMKYDEGETLRSFLARRAGAPLDQRVILHIAAEAMSGLLAAHKQGIVHRDLKPDNLYLARDQKDPHLVRILDFGVALLEKERGLTQSGVAIGTPQYMSPEQHRAVPGVQINHRADLWSMAAIVYEMATGRLPYHDEGPSNGFLTTAEIMYRMMTRTITDPRVFNPELTEGFALAILKALSMEPGDRFSTVADFAIALASATPGDAWNTSGAEILRKYAEDLLERDELLDTLRSMKPHAKMRYEIGDRLGVGGMAEVFVATLRGAENFERTFALKRVHPDFASNAQFAAMFIDEARIAAGLIHKNIVQVFDFNRDDDGRLSLVMEFIAGRDLGDVLRFGALPPSLAIFIAIEMLRGLGHAHERELRGSRGVIHRDVSPQNVLLSWSGAVKVSDFGIAKALDAKGVAESAMVKGKPAYMAPEQANAKTLDARSDLFAVGIVLWEMITGRRLFPGQTRWEVMGALLLRDAATIASTGVRVAPDLDAVVRKLLAYNPDDRFSSAAEAIDALTMCQDYPRDGERELIELLAARFPQRRRTDETRGERVAAQMPIASPVSTLSGIASESTPPVAPRPTRSHARLVAMIGLPTGIIAGVALFAVVPRVTPSDRESSTRTNISGSDMGSGSATLVSAAHVVPADVTTTDSTTLDASLVVDGHVIDASASDALLLPPHVDASAVDARAADAGPVVSDAGVSDAGVQHPRPVPLAMGYIHIVVLPWAEAWVDGVKLGQVPKEAHVTVGPHRVRLKNDDKEKTMTVIVTTEKTVEINENW